MTFSKAYILHKKQILSDTYIFYAKPPHNRLKFAAGQYVFLKNPKYKFYEPHPFSISSSPLEQKYLEFCIKVSGDWTREFAKLSDAAPIRMSEPQGNFLWDENITHAVFLIGGIGISPIMSILRFLVQNNRKPLSVTLLYGNKTPRTVTYKERLEALQKELPLKIVHVFSHVRNMHPWIGYRGFITRDIIREEVDLPKNPTFFLVGPPIFIEKMEKILFSLSIPPFLVKKELLKE